MVFLPLMGVSCQALMSSPMSDCGADDPEGVRSASRAADNVDHERCEFLARWTLARRAGDVGKEARLVASWRAKVSARVPPYAGAWTSVAVNWWLLRVQGLGRPVRLPLIEDSDVGVASEGAGSDGAARVIFLAPAGESVSVMPIPNEIRAAGEAVRDALAATSRAGPSSGTAGEAGEAAH